ncbi:hypothetical protein HELRODRAFT_180920 [Helobdella robusta]|uniref:Uncharacterized protein n=1 Tax=Helobdella robusta TaxID=6412 RepID=T1FGF0_HELRO|nr:hypothetical protein HELRODRAFT_180920 [Helobdella robusta]ESN93391.1 hypothetical protein HELRODRAFT_180920 [Helobdella robusta]
MDLLNYRREIKDYIEISLKKSFLGNVKLVKCTSSEVFVTDYIAYNSEIVNNVESNFVESVKRINDKYHITLKKGEVFRVLFSAPPVEEYDELEVQQKRNCSVIVNSSLHVSQHFDLKALRHLVVKNFIVKLLEYNGFDVFTTGSFPNNDHLRNLKNSFSGCDSNDSKIDVSNSERICDYAGDIMDVLKRNQFSELLDDGCLKINLKDYIDSSNMSHRYSSNVCSHSFDSVPPLPSISLHQVQLLSDKVKGVQKSHDETNEKDCPSRMTLQCIHIVDTDHYLQQQMDDVLWTMVDETCKHIHQVRYCFVWFLIGASIYLISVYCSSFVETFNVWKFLSYPRFISCMAMYAIEWELQLRRGESCPIEILTTKRLTIFNNK